MMDIRIDSRNVTMMPRWKKEIEERFADLQRGHEDLLYGRMTLTKNVHHKRLSDLAEAIIVITVPKRRTITARKQDKTFEEAIRASFEAVGDELKTFREKRGSKRRKLRSNADV